MPFLSFIFAALLTLAGAGTAELWQTKETNQKASEEVAAASMRITANAVATYLKDHPSQSGEIAMSTLRDGAYLPDWFNGDSRIRAMGKDNKGYLFIVPVDGERIPADSVMGNDEMPATLGLAMGGRLVNSVAGTILFDIPAEIPDGSLVYVI